MIGSLKGVVGQLSVVQGVRRPRADSILVIDSENGPAPGHSRGKLYALIELSGLVPPPPHLRRDLEEIVRREFLGSSGSIASSLEHAVLQINHHLYSFNRDSLRENRQGGGVTLAVLQGCDLYIAQGGPASAYLSQDGHVVRFPQYSPWLDEAVDAKLEEGPPKFLGASRQIKAELFQGQVRPDDCLVLSELLLGQIASYAQVSGALSCGDPGTSAGALADLVGGEDISVAVIQLAGDREDRAQADYVDEGMSPEPPALVRRSRPGTSRKGAPVGRRAPGKGRGLRLPVSVPQIDWDKLRDQVRAALAAGFALAVGQLKWIARNGKTLFIRTLPGPGDEADATVSRRKPKHRAPKEKRKEAQEEPQIREAPVARPSGGSRLAFLSSAKKSKVLKYAAFLIPVLVIAVAGLFYFEKSQETRNRYADLIQSAQANQEKALAEMADVAQARSLLAAALKSLDEADVIAPQGAEVAQLRKDILDKVDQVNQVKRLYWSPELHQYGTSGTDLSRIVVDGISVYVLDRGKNQVYKHTLNETNDGFQEMQENPVIVKQGDQVGDVVVSDLLDMAWVPAGGGRQTSNLVILDKKGMLYDYSPTFGVKHRPLAETAKWQFPQTVHGFYGNLYVMDTHLNQILKYMPTTADSGYGNAPLDYLSTAAKVDLSGAVDMSIDGSIYVLYANGTISKFMNGEQVAFQVSGLEQPLNNPSAIFVSSDEGTQYAYIADRGNHRVVQLTKQGRFQRQFKVNTNAFDDLRSLWVEELDQKMYTLSGNGVFAANLVSE